MEKDYAAKEWVTATRLVSSDPCELVYAKAVSDGGEIKDTLLYDGENTNGDLIINLQQGQGGNITLSPPEPIKCQKGLYVVIGDNTEGAFLMWRPISYKVSRG